MPNPSTLCISLEPLRYADTVHIQMMKDNIWNEKIHEDDIYMIKQDDIRGYTMIYNNIRERRYFEETLRWYKMIIY